MLNKDSISGIVMHSDAWFQNRLGKFTSSMIHTLMGKTPFTEGAMTYIMERVGEELSGEPAKKEVDTDATRWGLLYENEAIKKFGLEMGLDFLIVQKLIIVPETRFSSTPDFLLVRKDYGNSYDVSSGEVKCFPSYGHHIECALCDTPEKLKKADSKVYWQIIDQMDNCDCLTGYGVFYHPFMRAGGFKVIEFKKINLLQDFKLLKERKNLAVSKFNEIRDKMISI